MTPFVKRQQALYARIRPRMLYMQFPRFFRDRTGKMRTGKAAGNQPVDKDQLAQLSEAAR